MGLSGSKPTIESVYYGEFEASLPALNGKTVAVTGCTSGTGLVAAKCAARKGADHILMLNRASERASAAEQAVKAEIPEKSKTKVETVPCDLQDFDSVKQAASTIKKKCKKIDVLCNNAGVMALEDYATKDGYDVQMQTNHLSPFLLTKELFPLLKKAESARIVFHSSMARMGGPLKPEYFGKNGGNLGGNGSSMWANGAKWERYHQTKLANSCMALALSKKLEGTNVSVACAAPGLANTNLQTTTAQTGGMSGSMWIMKYAQSAEDGTMPLLNACFSPETVNGDFWEPKGNMGVMGMFGPSGFKGPAAKVQYDKNSSDEKQQAMLWEKSEEAVGKFEIN